MGMNGHGDRSVGLRVAVKGKERRGQTVLVNSRKNSEQVSELGQPWRPVFGEL